MHAQSLNTHQMASNSARVAGLLRRAASYLPHAARQHSNQGASHVSLAAFTSGSSNVNNRQSGAKALRGKNIFELRAAAATAEPETAAAEPIVLPTSDESEQLLRIRHSVSGLKQDCPKQLRDVTLPTWSCLPN
jgi:hypothetical protein